MKKILTLIFAVNVLTAVTAQVSLNIPRELQKAYNKGTRDISGEPGKNYWQNSAAYDINVSFDPSNRQVSGSESIVYDNNSPDTLRALVFKIFPNYYSKGVSRIRGIDSTDVLPAVKIDSLRIDGKENRTIMAGSNMYVYYRMLPATRIKISLKFSFTLNKGSALRGGESEKGAWFIPYFFPRIAVYDDVTKWDTYRYLGLAEFYNDFCDFKLNITVPQNYIVWATGTLTNTDEVFNPVYSKRISAAEKSDEIITIIDTSDIASNNITQGNAFNTFRFAAENVTDVAFAVSNHYLWKSSSVLVDSSSGRRTRVDAVFGEKRKDFYEVVDFARKTVSLMSYYFPEWPFPYQHETVFNCINQNGGMEFPMMVNDGNTPDRAFTIDVTLHEIFHTMFPFYTGINETKYGWMDEGMAILANWLLMPKFEPSRNSVLVVSGVAEYSAFAGSESDVPVSTLSIQLDDPAFTINSYYKPAMALMYLRDMIGEDVFLKGLHQFIRDWKGKHPLPYDFFFSMNRGTGLNLNWYWQRWFMESGVPDLAITGNASDKKSRIFSVEMKGQKPVPVDFNITFADGTKQTIHRSVAVWEKEPKKVELRIPGNKQVIRIDLGNQLIPDVNPQDNHLEIK